MLLKKANTITTPTAYSNGFLHSVKPEVVENLLLQSNQFGTTWAISGAGTLTSGQSGYDGSNDAWLLSKSASSTYISQNTTLSDINTFSVYAKAGTNTHLAFWIRNSNQGKFFDLANGTIGSDYVNTPIDAKIESVGGGWYRCSITTDDATNNCRIYPADADGDVSGTSGSIYIQDAQLNKGLTAYPYLETTTEAKPSADFTFTRNSSATRVNELGYIEEVTDDIPRINYEGFTYENGLPVPYSGKGHLLLEGQSTNLITKSNDFSGSEYIVLSANLTSNAAISPEGINNGSALETTSNFPQIKVIGYSISSAGNYTFSAFVKYESSQYILLRSRNFTNGTNTSVWFDIENGVKGTYTDDIPIDYNIEDYGNGWYRCSLTFSVDASDLIGELYLYNSNENVSYNSGIGDTTMIYGWQLEQGNISSYIPTNGSAVTRLGETCNNATHSFPSEGVLYAEIAALANDGTIRYLGMSDGTSNNRVVILYDGTANRIRGIVSGGGTKHFDDNEYVTSALDFHKVAIRYKDNDYSLWVDGVLAASASSGTAPTGIDRLEFDLNSGGPFYSKSKMVATFPYLSNDEMECLTGEGYGTFEALAAAYSYTIK